MVADTAAVRTPSLKGFAILRMGMLRLRPIGQAPGSAVTSDRVATRNPASRAPSPIP
jgi:hypothetical protein